MKAELKRLLSALELRPGATDEVVESLGTQLGVALPKDYVDFLRFSNGAEGLLGSEDGKYIIFWPAEEIVHSNREYSIREYFPELIVFGKNAATAAYAFDALSSPMSVIEADFIDPDYCEKRGDDFMDFLSKMAAL